MLTVTCLLDRAVLHIGAVRRPGARTANHWKTGGDWGGSGDSDSGTSGVRERELGEEKRVEELESLSDTVSVSESMASMGKRM